MEKKRIRTTAMQPKQQTTNLTGIPTQTKLEFETRSGFSFADVRVHYHSDKPAKIGAQAYTQGTQVYIAPGQELYLRHELGHVIQQKQGRVRATASIGGAPINDQIALEREADLFASSSSILPPAQQVAAQGVPVIQMTRWRWNAQAERWEVFARDQHRSNPPTRPGLEDGEIVDTSVSAHLYNAQGRRQDDPSRVRTRSDVFWARTPGDGQPSRIPVPTPFSRSHDVPYMQKKFGGIIINGQQRPKRKKAPTTKYTDLVAILDDWCSKHPGQRAQLVQEMLNYMESPGPIMSSQLLQGAADENVRRAANYFIAILTAAEPHQTRANPDGGKLARACLHMIQNGMTFANAMDYFPQAKVKGNKLHRTMQAKDLFSSDIELSASSGNEESDTACDAEDSYETQDTDETLDTDETQDTDDPNDPNGPFIPDPFDDFEYE